MTNDETLMTKEYPKPKPEIPMAAESNLSLEFGHSFVIRA